MEAGQPGLQTHLPSDHWMQLSLGGTARLNACLQAKQSMQAAIASDSIERWLQQPCQLQGKPGGVEWLAP